MGRDEASLKADLNPIKRVWKAKVTDPLQQARRQIEIDGNNIHDNDATQKTPYRFGIFVRNCVLLKQ
jgi:hypothetical protein